MHSLKRKTTFKLALRVRPVPERKRSIRCVWVELKVAVAKDTNISALKVVGQLPALNEAEKKETC